MNIDDDPQNIERIIVKKVPHDEKFKRFLTLLSDRDCLIIRIIYFHPITLSTLLNLRVKEIEFDSLPDSVQTDLWDHIDKKSGDDLVFVNKNNRPVERIHLINAVKLACKKMKCQYDITMSDIYEWTHKNHEWEKE